MFVKWIYHDLLHLCVFFIRELCTFSNGLISLYPFLFDGCCSFYLLNRCKSISKCIPNSFIRKLSFRTIYILFWQSMHLFGFVVRFKCFLCANWNCHPLCGSPLHAYRYGLMMWHWFRQINKQTHMCTLYIHARRMMRVTLIYAFFISNYSWFFLNVCTCTMYI